MAIKLMEHQKAAVKKLKTGSILVGGVGSGKSLTALAYYFLKHGGKIGDDGYSEMTVHRPLYIITTAMKRDKFDWGREAANFGIIPDKVDSWNNIQKYVDVKDAFVIFDEQRLVGSGAWVRAFYKIAKKNDWILLSATPGDTWMDYIPVFVANGFYANRTEFIHRHVIFKRFVKYPQVDRYLEVHKLIANRNAILVNMHFTRETIRHTKDVVCTYNQTDNDRLYIDRWNIFKDRPVRDISELCYALRRVANSDLCRVEKLLDLTYAHPKIIIFYNFDYELEILRQVCEDINIPYGEWNGHKHESIPKTDKWLYLVQYAAGAEAWECTETNAMVFYSQTYSYKTLEQAMGRIDRMNTPFEHLYYYNFLSTSQIDQAIKKALRQKRQFNESRFQN